jgi:hypothetical protein
MASITIVPDVLQSYVRDADLFRDHAGAGLFARDRAAFSRGSGFVQWPMA